MMKCEQMENILCMLTNIGTRLFCFHIRFFKKYYNELNDEIKDMMIEKKSQENNKNNKNN